MTGKTNKSINILGGLIGLTLFFSGVSLALAEPTGKEVMLKMDERDEGRDQVSRSLQILINRRGQERKRSSIYIRKNYKGQKGLDTKTVIFILSPPQVKGTAFMNWSYLQDDKDDNQWLYLPALRKVRRLSASEKEDSFMGTDFTYDDMGDRKVEEDVHKLLKVETLDGKECYVVESVPGKKGYMYSKKDTWVVKDEWIPLKVEYYDRKKRHLKTLTHSGWRKLKGVWMVGRMEMANHQTKHRTVLTMSDTVVNAGVDENTFRERTLKKGLRKSYFKKK